MHLRSLRYSPPALYLARGNSAFRHIASPLILAARVKLPLYSLRK
jgi:hypothetical protein